MNVYNREKEVEEGRGGKERVLCKRITTSKERSVKLRDRESRETWEGGEEGMRLTKSHLTQIDCSPLCQSQLSEQTTTLMCAWLCLCVCVWAYNLTFSPLTECKVFIIQPATVLFKILFILGYQKCHLWASLLF